jgi:hypothetical protein
MVTFPLRHDASPPAPVARWTPPAARDLLAAGRRLGLRLAACLDHGALLAEAVSGLTSELALRHAAVVLHEPAGRLAWRAQHGTLSVAQRRTAQALVQAVWRDGGPARAGAGAGLQVALPLRARGRLQGVLCVTGTTPGAPALEDTLVLVATHLAAMLGVLRAAPPAAPTDGADTTEAAAEPIVVRRYAANDSLFVDDRYLIKGVAGNILWKLLHEHQRAGRRSFTNKELRVDPALRLPELGDNLEARLILLRRRLAEHGAFARIEKTGRGRFELAVQRPLQLVEVA